MTDDLKERFRALDSMAFPHQEGPPDVHGSHAARPSAWSKIAVIVTALALSTAATGFIVVAFRSTSEQPPALSTSELKANGDIWAFVGGGDAGSAIYRVDPRTGSSSVLWSDRGWTDVPPSRVNPSAVSQDYSFSPDGSRVVFSSYWSEGEGRAFGTELFVMNADGTNIEQLTYDRAVNGFPAWSPDGDSIVFASYRGSGYIPGCLGSSICLPDLYVIDTGGGNPRQVTDDPGGETAPSWSPDGSRLVFVSVQPDGSEALEVMNADGTDQTRISPDRVHFVTFPDWSPDGRRIVYLQAEQGERFHLWTISPDGSDGRDLLDTNADTDFGRPMWSPDGEQITYSRLSASGSELWLTDSNGDNVHRLATWPRYGGAPIAWQPVASAPSVSPDPSDPALVRLPDLIGLKDQRALLKLYSLKLQGEVAYRTVAGAENWHVVSSDPAAGTLVDRKTDVHIVIATNVEPLPPGAARKLDCDPAEHEPFGGPRLRILPGGSAYITGNLPGISLDDKVARVNFPSEARHELWHVVRNGSVVAVVDFDSLDGEACEGSGVGGA